MKIFVFNCFHIISSSFEAFRRAFCPAFDERSPWQSAWFNRESQPAGTLFGWCTARGWSLPPKSAFQPGPG